MSSDSSCRNIFCLSESNSPKQPLAIIWFDMVTYPFWSVQNTECSLQTVSKMQTADCRIFNWILIFVFNLTFPASRANCNWADQNIIQADLSDVLSSLLRKKLKDNKHNSLYLLGYFSMDIICSLKLTVFLELHSQKTVCFSEQIMSTDRYPSIFSCKI